MGYRIFRDILIFFLFKQYQTDLKEQLPPHLFPLSLLSIFLHSAYHPQHLYILLICLLPPLINIM